MDEEAPPGEESASRFSLRAHWERKTGVRRYIGPKRVIALALLTVLIAVGWYLRTYQILDPAFVFRMVDAYPVVGPVLFILLYGAAVLTALPTIPFNLAAGMFWGPIAGGIFSALGTTLGSVGAFALARSTFGRPLAGRFDNKLVAEVQHEFDTKSWKFLGFMRLNPVFPTGPLNYVLALTSIGAFTYVWVTLVFLLPSSILVAYIGHSMGSFIVAGDVASAVRMILAVSAAGTLLVGLALGARLLNRVRRADTARSAIPIAEESREQGQRR